MSDGTWSDEEREIHGKKLGLKGRKKMTRRRQIDSDPESDERTSDEAVRHHDEDDEDDEDEGVERLDDELLDRISKMCESDYLYVNHYCNSKYVSCLKFKRIKGPYTVLVDNVNKLSQVSVHFLCCFFVHV